MAKPLDSLIVPTDPNLSPLTIQDPQLRVSNLNLEEPKRWKSLILQALFPRETVNEIEKIPLAQYQFHNTRSSLKWAHHSNGIFSVKSAYVAISIQSYREISHHPPSIWKKTLVS